MKNLVLVLAAMCVFTQATSVFESQAFLQIKANPFGNSIASLVQMNLSTGQAAGRLDAIAEVLNTVEAQLLATQEHNDAEIQRERGWCDDQIGTVKAQIESARNDLNNYTSEQSQLKQEQSDTNSNLSKEQQTVQENQTNLDNANQSLNEENERYEAAAKDYAEAIAACEQALQLLSSLRANPSGFIQSRARFGNVVALLQRHLSNKSSSFIQPVLNVLTELASTTNELDQAKLAKIVSLIEQLLQELRNQQASNDQRHQETVESLNNTIQNLEQVIKDSNDLIASYQGRLSEIADRLKQLEGLVAQTQNILDTANANLKDLENTCTGYDESYANYKNEVDQQLATLAALKEYFKNTVVPAVENVRDSSFKDELTVVV